jgi:hypothetical protein
MIRVGHANYMSNVIVGPMKNFIAAIGLPTVIQKDPRPR